MKYIIKLFPEIIIKSKSVRHLMTKVLQSNIRNVLKRHNIIVKVHNECPENLTSIELISLLQNIPGIQSVLEVQEFAYTSVHDIYEKTAAYYGEEIKNKTFCVRVKRKGKQEFTSIDVEKYVGGGLYQNFPYVGVKLKNPDLTIN